MDRTLKFKAHIDNIVNKSFRLFGWVVRTVEHRDKLIVLKIYKSLIRPNLEYASTVWNPCTEGQIHKIEKVQRRVTEFILGKNQSYENRRHILKLPSLRWRRHFLDLLRVYDILHNDQEIRGKLFTLNSEISSTNLRRHRWTLHGVVYNSNILKFHFVNRVMRARNALPEGIVDLQTYSSFKMQLKSYLMATSSTNPYKI